MRNEQVYLSQISEQHLDETRSWANDPELQGLILRSSYVAGKDQQNWFERLRESDNRVVFAIHRCSDGKHIGNTGYYEISRESGRADFWILIGDRSAWGHGLGSEALDLMLEYGFVSLNLNRIQLYVKTTNVAAIKLYSKFKFSNEGLLKEYTFVHGEPVDVYIMSLLSSDYR